MKKKSADYLKSEKLHKNHPLLFANFKDGRLSASVREVSYKMKDIVEGRGVNIEWSFDEFKVDTDYNPEWFFSAEWGGRSLLPKSSRKDRQIFWSRKGYLENKEFIQECFLMGPRRQNLLDNSAEGIKTYLHAFMENFYRDIRATTKKRMQKLDIQRIELSEELDRFIKTCGPFNQ